VYDCPEQVVSYFGGENSSEASFDGKSNRTTTSLNVLLPVVGEVAIGAEKEERLEQSNLTTKHVLEMLGMELRQCGSVRHSGFTLNFDRLVMLLSGYF